MLQNIHLDHLSVRKVYCDKTPDWIHMPFGVVIGVGQGMGVLDGVVIVEGEGAFSRVNLGCPHWVRDIWVKLLKLRHGSISLEYFLTPYFEED